MTATWGMVNNKGSTVVWACLRLCILMASFCFLARIHRRDRQPPALQLLSTAIHYGGIRVAQEALAVPTIPVQGLQFQQFLPVPPGHFLIGHLLDLPPQNILKQAFRAVLVSHRCVPFCLWHMA